MSLCSYHPDAGTRTRSGLGRRHLDVGHFVLFSRIPGIVQITSSPTILSNPIQSNPIQFDSRYIQSIQQFQQRDKRSQAMFQVNEDFVKWR